MSERIPRSSRHLQRMASDYEGAVSEARAEQLAARAVARASTAAPRRRPFAAATAVLSSFLVALVGLGAASGSALPGDPLYGVSRAYEQIGVWVGVVDPVEERLQEVIALVERGDRDRAVQAAGEALRVLGRTTGVTVSVPVTTTTTSTPDSMALATEETTTTTAPPTTQTAPEATSEDRVNALKLAAESLLHRVKGNGASLEDAVVELAVAVSSLESEEEVLAADETTTTSSTTTSSTTTTTTQPTEDETTTTTTTTTTVPEDEQTTDDGNSGKGRGGPIFLPPES